MSGVKHFRTNQIVSAKCQLSCQLQKVDNIDFNIVCFPQVLKSMWTIFIHNIT